MDDPKHHNILAIDVLPLYYKNVFIKFMKFDFLEIPSKRRSCTNMTGGFVNTNILLPYLRVNTEHAEALKKNCLCYVKEVVKGKSTQNIIQTILNHIINCYLLCRIYMSRIGKLCGRIYRQAKVHFV